MNKLKLWTIRECDIGKKLVDFLWSALGEKETKREIRRAIEQGQCVINHRVETRASRRLAAKEKVELRMSFFSRPKPLLKFSESSVLYEDEQILAYDKPAFVTCDDKGAHAIIRSYYPKAVMCHRLDAETSGVLLFAKEEKFLPPLLNLFSERRIQKTYVAIVDGVPNEKKGRIENHLGKLGELLGQPLYGELAPPRGRSAITLWEMKKKGKNASLLICRPTTGRTHQIRVHMASMGHPILGDYRYGRRFRCRHYPYRHLLHARRLQFMHPFIETPLTIESPIPNLFEEAGNSLELSRS